MDAVADGSACNRFGRAGVNAELVVKDGSVHTGSSERVPIGLDDASEDGTTFRSEVGW